jgi:F-type H+-transporting ATPase subunit b
MESTGLFAQLGIDWPLLISQAVNFFILLLVLQFFVYKPLLKVIKERNKKIAEGLEKAKEAEVRLFEVDQIAKAHLKKADEEAVQIIKDTHERARQLAASLEDQAHDHHVAFMEKLNRIHAKQEEESRELLFRQAADLVRRIVVKTIQLDPAPIDEALVAKAVNQVKADESF